MPSTVISLEMSPSRPAQHFGAIVCVPFFRGSWPVVWQLLYPCIRVDSSGFIMYPFCCSDAPIGVPFFSYFSCALSVIATGKAEILQPHLMHLLLSRASGWRGGRPPLFGCAPHHLYCDGPESVLAVISYMWTAPQRKWIVTVSSGAFTGVSVGKSPIQTLVLL